MSFRKLFFLKKLTSGMYLSRGLALMAKSMQDFYEQ